MKLMKRCFSILFVLLLLTAGVLFAEQEIIIPFGSSDFRYQFVHPGSEGGFEKLDYADLSFLRGTGAFGAASGPCAVNSIAPIKTLWRPEKELLVRKAFLWDSDLKNLKLSVAVRGSVKVFVNGRDISGGSRLNSGCPAPDSLGFSIPEEVLSAGMNLIAVRVASQGSSYFDLQLSADSATVTLIPYLDTGYKYRFVNQGGGLGFEKNSFDDTSFRRGNAGFGSTGGTCPLNNATAVKTVWPEKKDIQLRKFFELGSPQSLRVSVAADNGVQVFVNGKDISSGLRTKQSCGRRGDFIFVVPSSFLRNGDNLIAVRGRDFGGQRYLDLKVTIPTDVGQVIVPYLSTAYKYKIVSQEEGSGFEEPRFNDSSFSTGRAAFGSREGRCSLNNPIDVRTRWDGNNDILLRKSFDLGANAQNLTVSVAVDNAVRVFLNGVEISNGWSNHSGCPRRGSFIFAAPRSILKNGSNLLAVRARNFEALNYIDVQVRAQNP